MKSQKQLPQELYHELAQHELIIDVNKLLPQQNQFNELKKIVRALARSVDQKLLQASQNKQHHFSINVTIANTFAKIDFSYYTRHNNLTLQSIQLSLTKILRHCTFQNLITICFQNMQINNCQFLSFLDAPSLNNIYLMNNKISQIKSLQKFNLPQLQLLNIDKNLIKECTLQRSKLKPTCQSLVVEMNIESPVLFEDLSILFKINPQSYNRIRVTSLQRILTPKMFQYLEKRFTNQATIFNRNIQ